MKHLLLAFLFIYLFSNQATAICGGCPDLITVEAPGLCPEGIEWVNGIGFYISSATNGTIHKVADDGKSSRFVYDPNVLQGTLGLRVSSENGFLLAANNNVSIAFGGAEACFNKTENCTEASLVIADLYTGAIVANVDLSPFKNTEVGKVFANDVAVDSQGYAYVTDSWGARIYKVNLGNRSVVSTMNSDEWKSVSAGSLGLNGITYHKQGNYLVVSKTDEGKFFRIPLDNPTNIQQISVDQPIDKPDGILFRPSGHLVVVSSDKVWELESSDDWASAKVVNSTITALPGATTGTLRNDTIYITHAHFQDSDNRTEYEIEKIEFPTNISTGDEYLTGPLFNENLVGDWHSVNCEDAGNGWYMNRSFHFSEAIWFVNVTLYNDSHCKHLQAIMDIGEGAYHVFADAVVPGIPGALKSRFALIQRGLMALNQEAATYFTNLNCYGTFEVKVRKEIDEACQAFGLEAFKDCPLGELDVVKLDNSSDKDLLWFGARDQGKMCELPRPKSLMDDPVVCATACGKDYESPGSRYGDGSSDDDDDMPEPWEIAVFVTVIGLLCCCLCCICIALVLLLVKG